MRALQPSPGCIQLCRQRHSVSFSPNASECFCFFWARLNLQPDLHIVICWPIFTAQASASWQLLGRGERWSGHRQSQLLCRGFMRGTNWRQLAAFHPRREKTPWAVQPFLWFLAILQFPCQFSAVITLLLNVSECLCTLLSHYTVMFRGLSVLFGVHVTQACLPALKVSLSHWRPVIISISFAFVG